MTTGIKGCNNQSQTTVSFVNSEHPADSKIVGKTTDDDNVYAWISQHKDKPLRVQTAKGMCSIWDSNWKIMSLWDIDGNQEEKLADVKGSPQDFKMTVDETGEIKIAKR